MTVPLQLYISTMTQASDQYLQRFGGIARLYGSDALQHLHDAHFAVIGIGGVGTWVAESLARSGVGEITLVDMDDICITNSNRQIHAMQSTIGQQKIDVMAARLRDINPEITIHAIDDFLERENVETLLHDNIGLVVDAIDAAYTKAAMINHCKRRKIPIITVGSAGGKKDPRQIISGDLSKTHNDPLLARTRNNLRRLHGFSRNPKRVFSIEAIYSTEQLTYPDADGGTCQNKSALGESVRLDCSGGFGAATMVTATFGTVAAARAIEKYLSRC